MAVDRTTSPQEAVLKQQFESWFSRLQALTSETLNPDDWVGRWFDGYTPEDALNDGPEDNA